jgi:lipopolysaccharide export LptBFGC system permease protein LptF
MILPLIIIAICLAILLFILFYILVGKILNQEKTIFELTNRLESFSQKPILSSEGWYDESKEDRMNIIGQNGNDGEHYQNT